jgi:hypothetical protein
MLEKFCGTLTTFERALKGGSLYCQSAIERAHVGDVVVESWLLDLLEPRRLEAPSLAGINREFMLCFESGVSDCHWLVHPLHIAFRHVIETVLN